MTVAIDEPRLGADGSDATSDSESERLRGPSDAEDALPDGGEGSAGGVAASGFEGASADAPERTGGG